MNPIPEGGVEEQSCDLQLERLETVCDFIIASGATRVLDIGCGGGDLLVRLQRHRQLECIVGIDVCHVALAKARGRLQLDLQDGSGRIRLLKASFDEAHPGLGGFDAVALIETIEHINPSRLGRVEAVVFGGYRPAHVVITTPNAEYNVLYGMLPGQLRHPGHCFEWNRAKFRCWASGVAARNTYDVYFDDVGPFNAVYGAPTQMARFIRAGASGGLPSVFRP